MTRALVWLVPGWALEAFEISSWVYQLKWNIRLFFVWKKAYATRKDEVLPVREMNVTNELMHLWLSPCIYTASIQQITIKIPRYTEVDKSPIRGVLFASWGT